MTLIALAFCLVMIAFGVVGLVSPSRIVDFARHFTTPTGLVFATAVRIVMGLAFFFAASTSRAPEVLRALGVVIVVAGVVLPILGLGRLRRLLDWWASQGSALVRAQAGFALVLGCLLALSLRP